jgi:hypothetical protein
VNTNKVLVDATADGISAPTMQKGDHEKDVREGILPHAAHAVVPSQPQQHLLKSIPTTTAISTTSSSSTTSSAGSNNNNNTANSSYIANLATQQPQQNRNKPSDEHVKLLLFNLQSQLDSILKEEQANNPSTLTRVVPDPVVSTSVNCPTQILASESSSVSNNSISQSTKIAAVESNAPIAVDSPSMPQTIALRTETECDNEAGETLIEASCEHVLRDSDSSTPTDPSGAIHSSSRPERRLSRRRADLDLMKQQKEGLDENRQQQHQQQQSQVESPWKSSSLNLALSNSVPSSVSPTESPHKTQSVSRPGSLKFFHSKEKEKEPSENSVSSGGESRVRRELFRSTSTAREDEKKAAELSPSSSQTIQQPTRNRSKSLTSSSPNVSSRQQPSEQPSVGQARVQFTESDSKANSAATFSVGNEEKERFTKDPPLRAISGKRMHASQQHHEHATTNTPSKDKSSPTVVRFSAPTESTTTTPTTSTTTGPLLDVAGYQQYRVAFTPPTPGQYFVFVTFLDPHDFTRYLVHGSPIYLLVEDANARATETRDDESAAAVIDRQHQHNCLLTLSTPGLRDGTIFPSLPFDCALRISNASLDAHFEVSLSQSDGVILPAVLSSVCSILISFHLGSNSIEI